MLWYGQTNWVGKGSILGTCTCSLPGYGEQLSGAHCLFVQYQLAPGGGAGQPCARSLGGACGARKKRDFLSSFFCACGLIRPAPPVVAAC